MEGKVWVRRANKPPTLVQVHEGDLVDDVKTAVLSRYANSLGRTCDPDEISLRICSSASQSAVAEDSVPLQPDDLIVNVLARYFPHGQTSDEAIQIVISSSNQQNRSNLTRVPSVVSQHGSVLVTSSPKYQDANDYFALRETANRAWSGSRSPMDVYSPGHGTSPVGATTGWTASSFALRRNSSSRSHSQPPCSSMIASNGPLMLFGRDAMRHMTSRSSLTYAGTDKYVLNASAVQQNGPEAASANESREHSPKFQRNRSIKDVGKNSRKNSKRSNGTTGGSVRSSAALTHMNDEGLCDERFAAIRKADISFQISKTVHCDSKGSIAEQSKWNNNHDSGTYDSALNEQSDSSSKNYGSTSHDSTDKTTQDEIQQSTSPGKDATSTAAASAIVSTSSLGLANSQQVATTSQERQQQQWSARSTTETGLASIDTITRNLSVANLLDGVVPPINVLIVEDNIVNVKILETFLQKRKLKCDVARNGKEAVEKWRNGLYHLILMDIQLPVMSGIEAAKEIRRLERLNGLAVFPPEAGEKIRGEEDIIDRVFKSPVIIVALTASSLMSDRNEALAAGCNDFLTKPVNLVWLERKVREWGFMQSLVDYDGYVQFRRRQHEQQQQEQTSQLTSRHEHEQQSRHDQQQQHIPLSRPSWTAISS